MVVVLWGGGRGGGEGRQRVRGLGGRKPVLWSLNSCEEVVFILCFNELVVVLFHVFVGCEDGQYVVA
jgi:hypothetical protein